MRYAILLMLVLAAAPPRAGAQTPAAERQRAEAFERQAQQLQEAQRRLETAMREYQVRLAAWSSSGSASDRDSLQVALRSMETARVLLNRRLEEAVLSHQLTRTSQLPAEAARSAAEAQRAAMYHVQAGSVLGAPPGWLGITLASSWRTETDAAGRTVWRFNGYPVIESVEPGSPAARAGVNAGDVLVSLGGGDVVRGVPPFTELLRPGTNVAMVVRRGSATHRFTAQVVPRPGMVTYTVVRPAEGSEGGGTTVSSATSQSRIVRGTAVTTTTTTAGGRSETHTVRLVPAPVPGSRPAVATVAGAELFPIRTTVHGESAPRTGLFVLRVAPATPAANAGMRSGDVIVSANRLAIASVEAFRQAVEGDRSRRLTVVVVREGTLNDLVMRW